MSEDARAYQQYVTGAEPGWEFLRNGVRFDGLRLTKGSNVKLLDGLFGGNKPVLLDAKCISASDRSLYTRVGESKLPFARQGVLDEAYRQLDAARGLGIEWHVSDGAAAGALRSLFEESGVGIKVIHTPWTR